MAEKGGRVDLKSRGDDAASPGQSARHKNPVLPGSDNAINAVATVATVNM